jgi:hypothetical protein
MTKELTLPQLITLEHFNGNFHDFYEEVYLIFRKDFVNTIPNYRGKKLRLKKHPYIDGKEYTFYHFTHDGDIEKERLPNLRRMERIGYPRPIIENSEHNDLKVWKNKRGNNERILIFHEKEEYLVVLEDRHEYILPWTAYLVDKKHTKRKLLAEYESYKNQNRPA